MIISRDLYFAKDEKWDWSVKETEMPNIILNSVLSSSLVPAAVIEMEVAIIH